MEGAELSDFFKKPSVGVLAYDSRRLLGKPQNYNKISAFILTAFSRIEIFTFQRKHFFILGRKALDYVHSHDKSVIGNNGFNTANSR